MPVRVLVLWCALAAFVGVGPAVAQSKAALEPIPVATLLSSRTFAEFLPAAFSPDGKWVAYTVRARGTTSGNEQSTRDLFYRTGMWLNAVGASIWIVNIATGAQQEVTQGASHGDPPGWGNSWMPAWSPDSRSLAFVSDRSTGGGAARQARIWVWERGLDRIRLVSPLPVRAVAPPLWSHDGRRLLVTLLPEGVTPKAYAAAAEAEAAPASPHHEVIQPGATVTVYRSVVDTTPAAATARPGGGGSDGGGWRLNDKPTDLVWLDVATGSANRIVRRTEVHHVRLSPDGAHLAYTVAKRFEQAGSQQILWDLIVLDSAGLRVVAPEIRLNYDGAQFTWAPDSRHLAYRVAGMLANGDAYVVGLDRTAPRLISTAPHPEFSEWLSLGPLWDAAGAYVYFLDHTSLWKVPAAGGPPVEFAKLGDREGMLLAQPDDRLWSPDGGASTVVITQEKTTGRSGLARIDLAHGTVRQLVEEDNTTAATGRRMVSALRPMEERLCSSSRMPDTGQISTYGHHRTRTPIRMRPDG